MSPGNRIAIIAVGLVATILAFVALRPADDEETTSATATTAVEPTTTTAATAAETVQAPAPATTAAEPSGPETFTVTVKGGQPSGGVEEIDVERGDDVRIRVTSDQADEVHLHGYDIEKDVAPGEPAVFTLDATLEGIFEMELHGTGTPIANLRVSPK